MADGPIKRTVADVMTTDVLTAAPSDTVAATCERMLERGVGSVVVVEGDRPVGILTERDLVRVSAQCAEPTAAKVAEWMTPSPDTIASTAEVNAAFESLREHGYRHFPVVDDERLAGIVSLRDVLKLAPILKVEDPALPEAKRGLEGVVVAETAVGDVRGQEGFYHYRQYNAVELAEKRGLEDVWYLLYNGRLPSRDERGDFME
ncbi:MAG TPA: CBS domain-containing protein, partial [Acidimicrobiales bacterium]|nr:CBS domain-containing protein [Acidimicrobiales bacterium]